MFVLLIVRLLPLYAGVILISIGYSNYIGSGPFNTFFVKGYFENPCETNWWTNLLYINNVYKNKGGELVCTIQSITHVYVRAQVKASNSHYAAVSSVTFYLL